MHFDIHSNNICRVAATCRKHPVPALKTSQVGQVGQQTVCWGRNTCQRDGCTEERPRANYAVSEDSPAQGTHALGDEDKRHGAGDETAFRRENMGVCKAEETRSLQSRVAGLWVRREGEEP